LGIGAVDSEGAVNDGGFGHRGSSCGFRNSEVTASVSNKTGELSSGYFSIF